MALSKSVLESLKDSESSLRNALAFSARSERPFVAKTIATMIAELDSLIHIDSLMDTMEHSLEDTNNE
tara:strand:- start:3543 stop:3746 length:204 start_codon:yes stop_codon:yes gene_type:complete